MEWDITGIISVAANVATAAGLWVLVRQARFEKRLRAKESSQVVWDLLGAEEVYEAKLYLETHPAPDDFEAAMRENSPWIRAAMKSYNAYTKAATLVTRHHWMDAKDFAYSWGYPTLVVWDRLQPWIRWYKDTRSYPGFGNSLSKLVEMVKDFDDATLEFSKDRVGVRFTSSQETAGDGARRVQLPPATVIAVPGEPVTGDTR